MVKHETGPRGPRRGKTPALVVGLALLTAACGLFKDRRAPCVYEIPPGYRGWILVEYSQPTCRPLPVRESKRVFRIPADGRLCTSTAPAFGWARDEYYFVASQRTPIPETGGGGGGLVWARSNGSCGPPDRPAAVMESHYACESLVGCICPALEG